jgi:hypothetical protein
MLLYFNNGFYLPDENPTQPEANQLATKPNNGYKTRSGGLHTGRGEGKAPTTKSRETKLYMRCEYATKPERYTIYGKVPFLWRKTNRRK